MANILKKIKDPKESLLDLNQNFDNIAQEIADRSGIFSSVASVPSGITVTAGSCHRVQISVIDSLNLYTINKMPIIPRVNVYVGTDALNDYRYPSGASLTTAQVNELSVEVSIARTVFDETDGEKATYYIVFRNTGASDVTVYPYMQCYYVPAPDEGIAQR